LMGTVRRAVGEAEAESEAELDGTLGRTGGLSGGGFDRATAGETQWAGGAAASSRLRSGGAATGEARRAGSGVPHELPPDLGDHELDVREVVAELVAGPTEPYRAAVVRVETSEAAIRAAHHASAKFPDGQLYASLAGTPAVPPAAILRRFLRSLEVERPAEATTDELAAAFRSALAGRRMLVVLDGARSEAQIRPLIPAEGQCGLLVAFATGAED
jgi:hypothetical protein